MLDFSKENKFELDDESLDDFSIKIELKRSTKLFQKSKFRFNQNRKKIIFLSPDPVIASLKLGPNEPGDYGIHWMQMMNHPGERIFMWHELTCSECE